MRKFYSFLFCLVFSTTVWSADTFLDTGLVYNPAGNDVSAAWADITKDGLVDLYAGSLSATEAGVFINSNPLNPILVPASDIITGPGANHPGLIVDFDNDGDLDMYTSQAGAHAALNNGDGTFTAINGGLLTTAAADAIAGIPSECHAWGDFDNDGFLDYYRSGWEVASDGPYYPDGIFMNNAGSSFDVSWFQDTVGDWNEGIGDRRAGRGVTVADFDEDGDVDIYVSNYRLAPNYLWLNDGNANFSDVAVTYGVEGDGTGLTYTYGHTIGSAWGDLDNDGHLDLVAGNLAHTTEAEHDRPKFYRNMGPAGNWHFEDKSSTVALTFVESHASPALADFDNDGDLDVFITAVSGVDYPGQMSTLMRNDGNWTFTDVSATYGLNIATANTNFQAAWADYDNDGDLDLFTGRKLYKNDIVNGNNWLKVKLVGHRNFTNLDAVGAQVRIDLGGGVIITRQVENATGWGNQNDLTLHFGLGVVAAGTVDLNIAWPDGTEQTVAGVAVDQTTTVAYEVPWAKDAADDLISYGARIITENIWYAARTLPDANYFDDPDGVGSGTEMPVATSAVWGVSGDEPLMGDVDGDGVDDIVAVRQVGANFGWYAGHTLVDGDGLGSIGSQSSPASDSAVLLGVVAGSSGNFLADINGDGADDAICVYPGFNWGVFTSAPTAGLGGGSWQGVSQLGLDNGGDQPIVGDFNGDGLKDIGVYRKADGAIFWKDSAGATWGTGTVGPIGQIGGSVGQDFLIVCNLNDDGYDDVVMYRLDGAGLIQWWGLTNDGTGDLNFTNPGTSLASFGLDNGGDIPFMADVNGDGYDDICVKRAAADGTIHWFTGFTTDSVYPGEVELYAGSTGDDSGNFGSALDTGMFAKLDTTNDQDDIVVSTLGSADAWSGSRTRLAPVSLHGDIDTELYLPLTSEIFDPMLGDVDGDGIDDLVLRDPNNGDDSDPDARPLWIAYLSDADAKGRGYLSVANKTTIPQFGGVIVNIIQQFLGDVNGDGAEDAISVNSGFVWSAVYSIPNIGLDANKTTVVASQFGLSGDQPFIGDFDGDGNTDVGIYRVSSGQTYWVSSTGGVIGAGALGPIGQIGGGATDSIIVGNLNGDQYDDAVMVRQDGAGTITWFGMINDGTGLLSYYQQPVVPPAVPTVGLSIANFGLDNGGDIPFLADINGDGMDDIGVIRGSTYYVAYTTAGGALGTNAVADESQSFGPAGNIPLIGQLGTTCPGFDLDNDCDVDILDIEIFAADWLAPSAPSYNLESLSILAGEWMLVLPE